MGCKKNRGEGRGLTQATTYKAGMHPCVSPCVSLCVCLCSGPHGPVSGLGHSQQHHLTGTKTTSKKINPQLTANITPKLAPIHPHHVPPPTDPKTIPYYSDLCLFIFIPSLFIYERQISELGIATAKAESQSDRHIRPDIHATVLMHF